VYLNQPITRSQASRPEEQSYHYDFWLISVVIFLLSLGLVFVASSSITVTENTTTNPLYYFWKQLVAAGIGVGLACIIIKIPLYIWQQCSAYLIIFGLLLLILILIPGIGKEVNGSMRWIKMGPVSIQGSELIKVFVIIYLARYIVRHEESIRQSLKGFIRPIGVIILITGLLLLQPDYGTAVIIFTTALCMLFMGGVPFGRFFAWTLAAGMALVSLAITSPYRLQRLTSFLDPWQDPFNSGFQLTQALIAFGRGDWFGVGLGSSVQKLFYLPEAHTDFIFSVLAEELGLVGSVTVILLFFFIIWRSFVIAQIARQSGKHYAASLAYGIGSIIGMQAFVSIGVNMGILPTKGLTLPFISYGGNSMIISCILLAILIRIEYENHFTREDIIPESSVSCVK